MSSLSITPDTYIIMPKEGVFMVRFKNALALCRVISDPNKYRHVLYGKTILECHILIRRLFAPLTLPQDGWTN